MSVDPPLISIVVPLYNVAAFLPMTLASIVQQSEARWECILIDDGSKDDTFSVAERFVADDPRFQLRQQTNSGPSVARNLGFSLIHRESQFITFMDSDDVWTPSALADLLEKLENAPAMVAVSGLAEFIDGAGIVHHPGERAKVMRHRLSATPHGLRLLGADEPTGFASFCLGSDQFPPGVILGRRRFYDQAGGFDTSVHGCEDWDLLVRISRFGDVAFLDKIVLFYRRHGNNYGASSFVGKETWRVKCLIYHSLENSPEQKQIVRWAWKYSFRRVARQLARDAFSEIKAGRLKTAALGFAKASSSFLRSFRTAPLPEARSAAA